MERAEQLFVETVSVSLENKSVSWKEPLTLNEWQRFFFILNCIKLCFRRSQKSMGILGLESVRSVILSCTAIPGAKGSTGSCCLDGAEKSMVNSLQQLCFRSDESILCLMKKRHVFRRNGVK